MINADPITFGELLTPSTAYDDPVFMIPIYQRRYRWSWEANAKAKGTKKKDQSLKDFWDDVKIAVSRHREDKARSTHFFGPIVAIRRQQANMFDLVDGQQRLTTLVSAYHAVHAVAHQYDLQLKSHSSDLLLRGRDGDPFEFRSRLIPSEEDRRALASVLMNQQTSDQGHAIWEAFQKLRKEIETEYVNNGDFDNSRRVSNLELLLDDLKTCFTFIRIVIDSDDHAYEIFHSLNAKGAPLAESEKIKNYCFMQLARHRTDGEVHKVHNAIWRPMCACALGADFGRQEESKSLDVFLKTHLWIAYKNEVGTAHL